MSLRKRTLLIIGSLLILLLASFYALSQIFFLESYLKLEKHDAELGTQRIIYAFNGKLKNLDVIVSDWSAWDDTYKYAKDLNSAYITSNITESTFTSLSINFLLITNDKGRIIFKKALDLKTGEEMPFPAEIADHFIGQKEIVTHKDINSYHMGVLQYGGKAVIISARPILSSDKKGPIRGTIALGKILDETDTAKLAEITHQSLVMYYFENNVLPEDVLTVKNNLLNQDVLVEILNDDFIAGYAVVRDVYQKPSLIFKIQIPRSIYKEGRDLINIGLLAFLITGLIFGIAMLLVIEKFILSRMSLLSKEVVRIGQAADFSGRVSSSGNDEISQLNNSINMMLTDLQNAQSQVKTLRGLLPICAHCKKIRDDGGYWQQLEKYVGDHSLAEFTHSLCPQCVTKLYPSIGDKVTTNMRKKE